MESRPKYLDVQLDTEANEFSACILLQDRVTGYLRVAPPFMPTEHLLDYISTTQGVGLRPWASSEQATVFEFYRDESRESEFCDEPVERLTRATEELLRHAGMLSLEGFRHTEF